MLESKDIDFIKNKGIALNLFEAHIQNFKTGFPHAKLDSAATIGAGIIQFTENEIEALVEFFDAKAANKDILKFVPASGAATRMFKHLFEFRDSANSQPADSGFNSVSYFFDHLSDFAFFDDLKEAMQINGFNLEKTVQQNEYKLIINQLLNEEGLQLASLPKALIKFHNYKDGARLAIEEHLVEGAVYCKNSQGIVKIHFTVSDEHQDRFIETIDQLKPNYEEKFAIKYEISFSIQKPSTDIIAVDLQNKPLRDDNGNLVFRPGGHGALIENLNDIESDLVFVKNIDNIVPDRLRGTTYTYKKAIAAHLLKTQQKTFEYLKKLKSNPVSKELISEIEEFAINELFIDLSMMPASEDKVTFLFNKLNRPIRVCGMVKNEGEPGGGPFWSLDENDEKSLQIVESSQMDLANPAQKKIANNATHFNPVDLVCGVKDFQGNKFNLKDFVNPQTGFISKKSQNGKELKAQELPGLWNGAMADWTTIFVECPIITFNPVKIINDLLREQHR